MARFLVDLIEYHYAAIKKVFWYLKGTSDNGIWYERGNDFTLCTYTNDDWVGHMDDRKSTSGEAFFIGGRLVSWLSNKLYCISHSTAKVEYVVVANNDNQVVSMK